MSKAFLAKPIIKNQYWVVTNGQTKVGNVQSSQDGVELKINGVSIHYEDTKSIQNTTDIEFLPHKAPSIHEPPYAQWPTTGRPYNNILDIRRKMHLYTKTPKSKCYYAAGYYAIKTNDTWNVEFCPKYIFIQRYPYHGPFKNKEEAVMVMNSTLQNLKTE
jgi:hypothetical protein